MLVRVLSRVRISAHSVCPASGVTPEFSISSLRPYSLAAGSPGMGRPMADADRCSLGPGITRLPETYDKGACGDV